MVNNNEKPTCMTCKYWSPDHEYTIEGWCYRYEMAATKYESCDKHVPVKIEPIDKLKNPPQPVDKEEHFS